MRRSEWNPETYARFAGLRLQPAVDLLARIGALPEGDVVDLGCGAGAVGPVLRARFPERAIIGVDNSRPMLDKAGTVECYDRLVEADAALWSPDTLPALIYSNAALQWVGDHESLLPRLARALAPGGTLAVQMPHQNRAPSHRIWVDLVNQHFPGRHDPATTSDVLEPADYHRILAPLGRLALWETEYFQVLEPSPDSHPVRTFTSATFARPILHALDPEERAELERLYEKAMDKVYPRASDGSVLFPFRRTFFTLDI